MAELFQKTPQNITMHIRNAYSEGELEKEVTCKEYLQVQTEGKRTVKRIQKFYDLDVIISVGYRVKSKRGTAFRIWARSGSRGDRYPVSIPDMFKRESIVLHQNGYR